MKSENDETVAQRVTAPAEQVPERNPTYGPRTGSSLSRVQVDTGKLSRSGLRNTLIFIALGLLSFALPIVEFDPPVRGQRYVSVLEMSQRPEAESSKNSRGGLFDFQAAMASLTVIPFEWVYAFYATLVVALAAALVLPFRKVLVGISLAGICLLFVPFRGAIGLARMLQSSSFQSNRGGDLRVIWILFGVEFAMLAIVAWTDTGIS